MPLNPIDWPIIAAWAAVLVTLSGALYTRSQALSAKESLRLAREAKEATLDQAHSARDSAESARVAKEATVDQARSARESVEIARQTLGRSDRPRFAIKVRSPRPGQKSVAITIRMTGGPPAINVDPLWISGATSPIDDQVSDVSLGAGRGAGIYEVVLNETIDMPVDVPELALTGNVKFVLERSEFGAEDRTWTHVEVVQWKRLSPPRVY